MFDYIWGFFDFARGQGRPQLARLCAYLYAPVLVLVIPAADGAYSLGLDHGGALAVSRLFSEVAEGGDVLEKRGVAIIVEPAEGDIRLPLVGASGRFWTSLDRAAMVANSDRLRADRDGLSSRTPLLGVTQPVTVVVEGELATEVHTPGGTEPVENLALSSRRSTSVLSSILLACVFGFGMAFSAAIPAVRPEKNPSREVGAQPDKD